MKKYIILLSIIGVYLLGMYIWYIHDKNDNLYLIVRNNTIWSLHRNKWTNHSLSYHKEIDWTKFNIYSDGKSIGKYKVWYDEQWYVFDDKNQPVIFDGELFAYQSPNNIKAISFKPKAIENFKYVNALLNKYNINIDNNYTISNVISADIDSDKQKEDIYLVSNAFSETTTGKYYTFAFMVKNNKVYTIYNKTNDGFYESCLPYIDGIIDTDSNGKYELVFTCARFSRKKPINRLYEFKNNRFNELISN